MICSTVLNFYMWFTVFLCIACHYHFYFGIYYANKMPIVAGAVVTQDNKKIGFTIVKSSVEAVSWECCSLCRTRLGSGGKTLEVEAVPGAASAGYKQHAGPLGLSGDATGISVCWLTTQRSFSKTVIGQLLGRALFWKASGLRYGDNQCGDWSALNFFESEGDCKQVTSLWILCNAGNSSVGQALECVMAPLQSSAVLSLFKMCLESLRSDYLRRWRELTYLNMFFP